MVSEASKGTILTVPPDLWTVMAKEEWIDGSAACALFRTSKAIRQLLGEGFWRALITRRFPNWTGACNIKSFCVANEYFNRQQEYRVIEIKNGNGYVKILPANYPQEIEIRCPENSGRRLTKIDSQENQVQTFFSKLIFSWKQNGRFHLLASKCCYQNEERVRLGVFYFSVSKEFKIEQSIPVINSYSFCYLHEEVVTLVGGPYMFNVTFEADSPPKKVDRPITTGNFCHTHLRGQEILLFFQDGKLSFELPGQNTQKRELELDAFKECPELALGRFMHNVPDEEEIRKWASNCRSTEAMNICYSPETGNGCCLICKEEDKEEERDFYINSFQIIEEQGGNVFSKESHRVKLEGILRCHVFAVNLNSDKLKFAFVVVLQKTDSTVLKIYTKDLELKAEKTLLEQSARLCSYSPTMWQGVVRWIDFTVGGFDKSVTKTIDLHSLLLDPPVTLLPSNWQPLLLPEASFSDKVVNPPAQEKKANSAQPPAQEEKADPLHQPLPEASFPDKVVNPPAQEEADPLQQPLPVAISAANATPLEHVGVNQRFLTALLLTGALSLAIFGRGLRFPRGGVSKFTKPG